MGNRPICATSDKGEAEESNRMLNVPSTSGLTAKPPVGRSEYGRVKVALGPGKGLMDWVRLTKNKVLAKKQMKFVDHEELSKHSTEEDCWIHLFGKVYDVTEYLDFHPGGKPELMRAAGRDGTALFNQYHAWVRYETILESCYVGAFKGNLSHLKPCDPPSTENRESAGGDQDLRDATMVMTMFDRLIVANKEWKGISSECLTISTTKNSLRILVRPFNKEPVQIEWVGVPRPIAEASFKLEMNDEQIILIFDVTISIKILESAGIYKLERNPARRYHATTVTTIKRLNHDTLLIDLELPRGLYMPIPVGHHNSLAIKKGAATIYREYTPVSSKRGSIQYMIKIYEDGLCTPTILKWKEGDEVLISDPIGDWDLSEWLVADDLLVLAAGSGWTPMVELLRRKLELNDSAKISAFYFNKSERDIVDDGWMPFRWHDKRIKITHVLSRSTDEWKGIKGRISKELFEDHTSQKSTQRVIVCGPDGFIQSALSILADLDYAVDQVHVFQG